jgi:predicted DNA-binding transcriptional regulator AlpA
MKDDLINTKQLAQRTNTSEITWAKRRMLGEPHSPRWYALGRSVRYRWSDVEAWLETRQRQSTSEAA